MNPNPAPGVFFHWLGGLASASFYLPYRGGLSDNNNVLIVLD